MIGIVLVSHSRALVEALMKMVGQVAGEKVRLAAAAGVGPDREELGTDAVQVAEAIQSVSGPEGVLVLADMGSALLSAEMALELLPPEFRGQVKICPGPLVEGAIAAAVQAGLGSDLETVCREASKALLPKQGQLGEPPDELPQAEKSATPTGKEIILTIRNPHGLHARPAASFVRTAGRFDALVQVTNLNSGRGPVPGTSINSLATLGAIQGHRISISAAGTEAAQALAALAQLVEAGFQETNKEEGGRMRAEEFPSSSFHLLPSTQDDSIEVIPVGEGIAVGPLFLYQPPPPLVPTHPAEDPAAEWERLQIALGAVQRAIQARRNQAAARLGEGQAGIFEAHRLILEDSILKDEAREGIFSDGQNAAAAWHQAVINMAGRYKSLEDTYLQQRGADLIDVGNQVLYELAGEIAAAPPDNPEPAVLLAEEISPNAVAQLDPGRVLGLITLSGGPTSHSAILARTLGIPTVTGAPPALADLPGGTLVALDGAAGTLWVNPSPELQAELLRQREAWLAERSGWLAASHEPAVTRDGRSIDVAANAGSLQDAALAERSGAEGIGVLRTEFLYLNRETPPAENEQLATLEAIGEALKGRPVTIRTLDVGGDKNLPYIEQRSEANPYLGVRGLRLSLQQPELFLTQLRAILRAGAKVAVQILFPMVTNLNELSEARQQVEAAHQALLAEGLPHLWPVETGIMIEVPGAALLAPAFAPHVDFFSIGTNDLTQYTLAAERGNPALLGFADALHPAVLRLVQEVVNAGHSAGKWVGVCGEIAGDPIAAPVLVGLGVDELSLNPAGIPRIKAAVRAIEYSAAQALAVQALGAESAEEARKLAIEFFQR